MYDHFVTTRHLRVKKLIESNLIEIGFQHRHFQVVFQNFQNISEAYV